MKNRKVSGEHVHSLPQSGRKGNTCREPCTQVCASKLPDCIAPGIGVARHSCGTKSIDANIIGFHIYPLQQLLDQSPPFLLVEAAEENTTLQRHPPGTQITMYPHEA